MELRIVRGQYLFRRCGLAERGAPFLGAVVSMRFQMVFGAWTTKEVNDFRLLIHGVATSGIELAVRAFWTHDAEASASSVASASCYGAPGDVCVLAVVVAERKLVQIQRQVLRADVVIGADDAALQERPEGFDVVRVNHAPHVLACFVIDGDMLEHVIEAAVTDRFVSRDQIDPLGYRLADEFGHGQIGRAHV